MTQPAPPPTPAPPGDPAPAPTEPPATPPEPDKPLGPAGEKALREEREARKALERQLAELAPLKDLATALAGGRQPDPGKSAEDLLNERFARYETDLLTERSARWRAEVAAEKGLTALQAARLQGETRDDLAADADALVALFPTAPVGPRTPVPDPSQGARGGQPGPYLDARIAEAQAKGDWRTVIALQNSKLNP